MPAREHPYPGFSGRLALIPFESPAIVGSSPCSDAVRSARGLFGDAPEARRRGAASFSARRDWRRAGSPRGADAEAKASGSIRLAEATSGYPPRRQANLAKQNGYSGAPEKARSEPLPAPQRRQRVCQPLPSRKIWDKGAESCPLAARPAFRYGTPTRAACVFIGRWARPTPRNSIMVTIRKE